MQRFEEIMTIQFHYLDRDVIVAQAKNETEIAQLQEQIEAAEVALSDSENNLLRLTDGGIEAVSDRLAGK
jgi:hypothetical protein